MTEICAKVIEWTVSGCGSRARGHSHVSLGFETIRDKFNQTRFSHFFEIILYFILRLIKDIIY